MDKIPVIGAKERNGMVIVRPDEYADSKTATGFAIDSVEEGVMVYTDESRIYNNLPFMHDSVNHSRKEWAEAP